MLNLEAIKRYQCCGCVLGYDTNCGSLSPANLGVGCGNHYSGTRLTGSGLIFAGMPKAFSVCGFEEYNLGIEIYEKFGDNWAFNFLNIPVWKWRNKEGHVFIRGLQPHINKTFVLIFLSDEGYEDIHCHELTIDEINSIDNY